MSDFNLAEHLELQRRHAVSSRGGYAETIEVLTRQMAKSLGIKYQIGGADE